MMMTSGEHTKLGVPPGEDVVLLDHEGVQIAMMLRGRCNLRSFVASKSKRDHA